MRRSLVTTAALATASVALVAGCSSGAGGGNVKSVSDNQSPSQQISTAFTNLSQGSTVTATLKLGLTSAALQQFVSGTGGNISSSAAQALTDGSLVVTEHANSGTLASAVGKAGQTDIDVSLVDGGTTLADIRNVGSTLYLQVDLKDFLSTIGQPASVLGNLQAEVGALPSFVQALVAGRWVSITDATIKDLVQQGLSASGQSPPPSPDASAQAQFLSSLENLLTTDVTVTTGSTSGSYTLTADTRQLAGDFISDLETYQPSLKSELSQFDPSSVPDQPLTLHATVADDKLTQLSFDIAQLAPASAHVPAGTTFPVLLDFDTADRSIDTPSGATAVDMTQLQALLEEFVGGITANSASMDSGVSRSVIHTRSR